MRYVLLVALGGAVALWRDTFTGFLGGFTTFSACGIETVALIARRGRRRRILRGVKRDLWTRRTLRRPQGRHDRRGRLIWKRNNETTFSGPR